MAETVTFNINGKSATVRSGQPLLSAIRDELNLTGTKYGCGESQCGACTVLIEGEAKRSCVIPVDSVAGQNVRTIESISENGKLHPVQQAFLKHEALQCGYCTSGMIMGAVAFLERNPDPTEEEIVKGMNRHICRCGTYPRIVAAIQEAAKA